MEKSLISSRNYNSKILKNISKRYLLKFYKLTLLMKSFMPKIIFQY